MIQKYLNCWETIQKRENTSKQYQERRKCHCGYISTVLLNGYTETCIVIWENCVVEKLIVRGHQARIKFYTKNELLMLLSIKFLLTQNISQLHDRDGLKMTYRFQIKQEWFRAECTSRC